MTRRGWVLFALMSVIWGTPYLFIKLAVAEVAPPVVVVVRTAVAALVLVPLAARQGALRPALRRWRPLALFILVEMAGPWILLADAERHLPSSITGLLVATVPLMGTIVAVSMGDRDALRPVRLIGLATGLGGVALLVGIGHGAPVGIIPVVEVLLVAAGYTIGPFIAAHHLDDVPSLGVMAIATATVALLYAGPAIATAPERMPSAPALGSLLALALLCTATAFVLFFALIAEAGPVRASLITFVNPAVAIGLGVVILGEPLTAGLVLGTPLVITGCWLASRTRPPAPVPEPTAGAVLLTASSPSAGGA